MKKKVRLYLVHFKRSKQALLTIDLSSSLARSYQTVVTSMDVTICVTLVISTLSDKEPTMCTPWSSGLTQMKRSGIARVPLFWMETSVPRSFVLSSGAMRSSPTLRIASQRLSWISITANITSTVMILSLSMVLTTTKCWRSAIDSVRLDVLQVFQRLILLVSS